MMEVLLRTQTFSMAMVGTSAISIRLIAFAIGASTPTKSKTISNLSSLMC